jgi:hypothetical protein
MTIQSATIIARLSAVDLGANDFGGPVFAPTMEAVISLTAGTAAGEANLVWFDERAITTGASLDLDLSGVLTDAFGATITAVELVALFVINGPRSGTANTTNLTIGAGTNPIVGYLGGTNPTIGPIRPGSFVLLGSSDAAGYGAITAATGDILRITNSAGATNNCQIAFIARSA